MPFDWPNIDSSVPDWLVEFPHLLRLVEDLGLDYTCGGKSLNRAARDAGLDPADVLNKLSAAAQSGRE